MPRQSVVCERGREWISLRLDGELSELAQKMLDAHLARCADCRAFEAEAAATTGIVRSTPLVPLERQLSLPRGRRLALSMRRVSAMAASAAAIALGVAAFLNVPSSGNVAVATPVHVSPSGNTDIEQFRLNRAALLRPVVLPPRPTHGPQKS